VPPADFEKQLLEEAPGRLQELGAKGVQLNLADESVVPAASLMTQRGAVPVAGLLQLWLDTSHERVSRPNRCGGAGIRRPQRGYLVTESVIHRTQRALPQLGRRTEGWSLVSLIERPPRLDPAAWLDVWQRLHVPVALATQDIHLRAERFRRARADADAPPYDAFVEEGFPDGAMSDPAVFFDAVGNAARQQSNADTIMASCARFLDFDRIDVVPMSQFVMRLP